MLEIINAIAHGFTTIPMLAAAKETNLFEAMRMEQSLSGVAALAEKLAMNAGPLKVMLNTFVILGYLERNAQNQIKVIKIPHELLALSSDAMPIYKIKKSDYFSEKNQKILLAYLEKLKTYTQHDEFNQLLAFAPVLIPSFLILYEERKNNKNYFSFFYHACHPEVSRLLKEFFLSNQWITDSLEPTLISDFLVEHAYSLGTVYSYQALFGQYLVLLTGRFSNLFSAEAKKEKHVDRKLNVLASGFQHQRYFKILITQLLQEYRHSSFSLQPQYIIDMGCGDGSLLKSIYMAIISQTDRGKNVKQFPITLIGVDYNEAALTETANTLKGLPHQLLQGDINQPEKLEQDLLRLGINTANAIHIRSFIDHNRPFVELPNNKYAARIHEVYSNDFDSTYISDAGGLIDPPILINNLISFLAGWEKIVNQHGLLLLEVHSLSCQQVKMKLAELENCHFDAYHALSKQYLVKPEVFLLAAAMNGLFSDVERMKVYPELLPYKRIACHHFHKKNYFIRLAENNDIPQLMMLEKKQWAYSLLTPEAELLARIARYPEAQFVIENSQQIIGVIYTQPIKDMDRLKKCTFKHINTLYDREGDILQILGMFVDPMFQLEGIGEVLIRYIEQWTILKGGFKEIIGISRCEDSYHMHADSYEQYALNNINPKDKILAFHHRLGAKIDCLIENYRSEDHINLGYGVLIRYRLTGATLHTHTPHKSQIKKNVLLEEITKITESLLEKKLSTTDLHTPLRELGIDSLSLMQLRSLTSELTGQSISAAFFFEHNTLAAAANFLIDQVHLQTMRPSICELASEPVMPKESINIVGMSCAFPETVGIGDYWTCLKDARPVISKRIIERCEYAANSFSEKIIAQISYAGLLKNYSEFDAGFFNISPREAALMDPQQRLLLMHTWHALEHAGFNPNSLRRKNVGVFVGSCGHDFSCVAKSMVDDPLGFYATGSASSMLAGRIAYFFDWHGPALTIDTACSSSLVALSLAEQSLLTGQCEIAIVAGVNLLLDLDLSVSYAKAGMLSPTGQCRVFDADANGYVRSEGVAVCVLTKHSFAKENSLSIWGTIEAIMVNHDGASNGITAPNPAAQTALIKGALLKANCQPRDLDYIETHGTGTPLGDPIELSAIASVFESDLRIEPCYVGSVKSNIGHTEGVAGLAGLIKILLALHYEYIPANTHFNLLNPEIKCNPNFLIVAKEAKIWQKSNKRRYAGISSFGFSGSNVHAIISDKECTEDKIVDSPLYAFQMKDYPLAFPASINNKNQHEYDIKPMITSDNYFLKHHIIAGQSLVPAAFYLALVLNLYKYLSFIQLEDCLFIHKLYVDSLPKLDNKKNMVSGKIEHYFQLHEKNQLMIEVAKITINLDSEKLTQNLKLEPRSISLDTMNSAEFYQLLSQCGYFYQNSFQSIQSISFDMPAKIARGIISISTELQELELTTVIIDAGLQVLLGLIQKLNNKEGYLYFPYNISNCKSTPNIKSTTLIDAKIIRQLPEACIGEIEFYDKDHQLTLKLTDVVLKCKISQLSAKLEWRENPLSVIKDNKIFSSVFFFGNKANSFDTEILTLLKSKRDVKIVINPGEILNLISSFPQTKHIVYAVSSSILSSDIDLLAVIEKTVMPLLDLFKLLQKHSQGFHCDVILPKQATFFLSGISGLLKSLALELAPQHRVKLIYIENSTSAAIIDELLLDNSHDNEVLYQGNKRYLCELKWLQLPSPLYRQLSTQKTILITGGLGALGLVTVKALLALGYQHFVLVARTRKEHALEIINTLQQQGAMIEVNFFDATNFNALANCIAKINASSFPLGGIVHCAGVLKDSLLAEQEVHSLREVCAAKVLTAWYLHQLTVKQPLEFFICYSSVTGIIGHAGQANYAYANACLDNLMQWRRAQQLTGLSVCFGPWDVGMAKHIKADITSDLYYFETISTALGQSLIEKLISNYHQIEESFLLVAPADWENLIIARQRQHQPLYLHLEDAAQTVAHLHVSTPYSLSWAMLSKQEITKVVIETVLNVLQLHDIAQLDVTTPLKEFGLESFTAVMLRNQLMAKSGKQLPVTFLFDYPSVEKIVDYLFSSAEQANVNVPAIISDEKHNNKIAIVGTACRFPGNVKNLQELWAFLSKEQSGIVEMVAERWEMSAYYDEDYTKPGKMNSKYFGLLNQVHLFDAEFFGLTPKEAIHLDPQQRLLLTLTWEALENAGYAPSALQGSETGVFLGIMNHDYIYLNHDSVIGEKSVHSAYYASGEAFSAAAGRLAYFFDWHGPTMAIDTACSSSLVALHLACQSIALGESAQAIAAGVNLILSPEMAVQSAHANMLSPTGQCHTFDQDADGYVRAEGAGVLFLKAYDRAIADGDHIWGVICATAVNQDGKSQGLTAPSRQAQENLLRNALKKAKLLPDQITYIEAHGTGTPLGDPIELAALQAVYAHHRSHPLFVGSIKTNIGHAESAAGMAGIFKVLTMLQYHQIPTHLNLKHLNQHIQLNTQVHIPKKLEKWHQLADQPRMAGISSFGFSGTNAHVIVSEYISSLALPLLKQGPWIFKFSAKSKESLIALLQKFYNFFTSKTDMLIADVSYTLACGRDDFMVRCAIVSDNYDELSQALLNKIKKLKQIKTEIVVVDGKLLESSVELEIIKLQDQTQYLYALNRLADDYEKGANIPWEKLFTHQNHKRIPLPTYAFIEKQYWVNDHIPEVLSLLNAAYQITWRPANEDEWWNEFAQLANGIETHAVDIYISLSASKINDNCILFTDIIADFGKYENQLYSARSILVDARYDYQIAEISLLYYQFLQLLQRLSENKSTLKNIFLLTFEANSLNNKVNQFMAQPLAAMLRVFFLENPNIYVKLIDVDSDSLELALQFELEEAEHGMVEVSWRKQKRFEKTLTRLPIVAIENLMLDQTAAYFISGGHSGLGLLAAEALVKQGAKILILVSRRGIKTNEDAKRIEYLQEKGISIVSRKLDMTDKATLFAFINEIQEKYVIKGVIHSAGVIKDGILQRQTKRQFDSVITPKILGSWYLHEAFQDKRLDFFVLFSSLTSLLGNAGQVNYAAGNAFMDSLVQYRQSLGLPGLSINWGAWKGVGLAEQETVVNYLTKQGIEFISTEEGLNAFLSLLFSTHFQVMYAKLEWITFAKARRHQSVIKPFLTTSAIAETGILKSSLQSELSQLTQKERFQFIQDFIIRTLSTVSGVNESDVLIDKGFMEMGIDSLMAEDLLYRLEKALGKELMATSLFDYPTPHKLTQFIVNKIEEDLLTEDEALRSLNDLLMDAHS